VQDAAKLVATQLNGQLGLTGKQTLHKSANRPAASAEARGYVPARNGMLRLVASR